MQIQIQNPANYEQAKSTKGASKDRRDKINAEIEFLKHLLPLPHSIRSKLKQLQLMALVCVYIRKTTYFKHTFDCLKDEMKFPQYFKHVSFTKALSGFIVMMTQNGKLLYISDNAADYLGHSMEDLLISGDSVYDIIDNKDHAIIRETLETPKNSNTLSQERREFLCSIIANKSQKRQMRFGDQKLVLVSGHYFGYIQLSSTEVPVFVAHCSPVVMPETREFVSQGNCLVYSSMHSIDLKYVHLDRNGESHLGVELNKILSKSMSFYEFVHPEDTNEVAKKHIALSTPNSTEKSAILLVRMQSSVYYSKPWCWTHLVMQLKEPTENGQAPLIIITAQVLSEREARVLHQNKSIYENYSQQTKMQYLTFGGSNQFNRLSSSQSSENSTNSSPNSPLLSQNGSTHNCIKRSRSANNSPSHPYMFNHQRSRLSSPPHQLNCNTNSSLPSPTTAASISSISPAMPNAKTKLANYLNNENSNHSNSSTNLTSDTYLTANSNYGLSCLSPNDTQTANNSHSTVLHHVNLNPIAPLNVNSEINSLSQAVTPFRAHNLLQYSPQAGTLPTYPHSFVSSSLNSTTSLFTHSPQQASSVITNTTPPATPPEIVVRHSSSTNSNNSSLNSNSSSQNGSITTTSNKRSLNSSSSNGSLSSSRSSPEPKRAYLGQNSSFSHFNNGYAGFNHHYTYNVNVNVNNYNSQTNSNLQATNLGSKLQNHHQLMQQQMSSQATPHQLLSQHQQSASQQTAAQQQYSFHHNRWLPITANSFSDLMPSMSNYYNAATAHSTHQLNQLAHRQLNTASHQQILPNINISNINTNSVAAASINQTYPHLNYRRTIAGQKLNLFNKDSTLLDPHLAQPNNTEEISNPIAIY